MNSSTSFSFFLDTFRRRWAAISAAALALLLAASDPLGLGPLGDFARDYDPMSHDIAPYHRVMGSWPRDAASRLKSATLHSKGLIHGPESLEFDASGGGPYTGLADGRVVRWSAEDGVWRQFAVASPRWDAAACLTPDDDDDDDEESAAAAGDNAAAKKERRQQQQRRRRRRRQAPRDERRCGRPLGLRFPPSSPEHGGVDRQLYFADAYYGLLSVGPGGGVARVLSAAAEARPILFANDLDIHTNGSVFFTDSSARHNRLEHHRILLETENTGRLLRYDPATGQTTVVLKGLSFPNGVQLSRDQDFLLVTETANCRVLRYWVEGERKGEVEVFADLPGFPDNVRRNDKGQFWVAIDCCRTRLQQVFSTRPFLRRLFFKLPLPISLLYKIVGMRMFTMITLFDEDGNIVDSLEDTHGEVVKLVSEVQHKNNTLWIGSVHYKQIVIFPYD